MPYVKVKELLAMGKKNNACVLAFDAADVNMIKSVIKGAETAGRPVIVMLYPGMRNIMPFGVFAEVTILRRTCICPGRAASGSLQRF